MLYIKDLPKQRVLVELFNNAYRKSTVSENEFLRISTLCHEQGSIPPLGTHFLLEEHEASDVLSQGLFVHQIGAVDIGMDFSLDEIDETHYDSIHEVQINRKLSCAKECLDKLRNKLAEEESLAQQQQIEKHERSSKMYAVSQLINKVLNNTTGVVVEANNGVSIEFYPQLSDSILLGYANIFLDMSLAVKLEKSSSIFGGLISAPGKLILLDNLDFMSEKLTEYLDSPKQAAYRCVVM